MSARGLSTSPPVAPPWAKALRVFAKGTVVTTLQGLVSQIRAPTHPSRQTVCPNGSCEHTRQLPAVPATQGSPRNHSTGALPMVSSGSGRNASLDVLRFGALAMVMLHHVPVAPPGLTLPWRRVAEQALWGGWLGVDLFFVLSGFLVSGLLFREYGAHGSLNPWRFLVRRGFKIYPSFWIFLTVIAVADALRSRGVPWARLGAELLFVQNYLPGLRGHTWSLAVEEHFYLLLPAALFLLTRRSAGAINPFRTWPAVIVGLSVFCLGWRLYLGSTEPVGATHYVSTHLRIDALGFGSLLAYANQFHPERLRAFRQRFRALLVPGSCLVLAILWAVPMESYAWVQTWGYTLAFLYFGVWLMGGLGIPAPGPSTGPGTSGVFSWEGGWRLMARLGTYSYPVYLLHVDVQFVAFRMLYQPAPSVVRWFAYVAIYLLGSFALGITLSHCLEWPLLRLRNRWFPSRT